MLLPKDSESRVSQTPVHIRPLYHVLCPLVGTAQLQVHTPLPVLEILLPYLAPMSKAAVINFLARAPSLSKVALAPPHVQPLPHTSN